MQPVKRSSPDGVDYGQVTRMTFIMMILVGSPTIIVLPVNARLQTWGAYAEFVIRVGAATWSVTVVALFVYTKRTNAGDGGMPPEAESDAGIDVKN